MTTDDMTTLVSLRDYLTRMLDDHCVLDEARSKAQEEAMLRGYRVLEAMIQANKEVTDARLLVQNEWRMQSKDQTATYATITSMHDLEKSLAATIDSVADRVVNLELRQSNLLESSARFASLYDRVVNLELKQSNLIEATTRLSTELLNTMNRVGSTEKWSSNLTGRLAVIAILAMTVVSIVTAIMTQALSKVLLK
jgi:hypothetical protein